MKKIIYSIIIFVLSLCFIPNVLALDTSLKIYDDANLLTPEEEANLKLKIDAFIEE